jgi:hypothetical protein
MNLLKAVIPHGVVASIALVNVTDRTATGIGTMYY